MGFEPTTPTLARLCSTPELHPHPLTHRNAKSRAALQLDAFAAIHDGDAGCGPGCRQPAPQRFAMAATPAELFAFLDRLGVAHSTVTHPPLFTVEQSQSLRGTIPGGHTKNLFLKDKKGALFLVTALEDAAIDLKSLHRRLGAGGRFSFGSADLLRATLGVEPGAVTPFGAINDTERRVTVVLDQAMMQHAPSTIIRWSTP